MSNVRSFGYKVGWIAVPIVETAKVIEAFGLRDPIKVSWQTGLEAAYSGWTVRKDMDPESQQYAYFCGTDGCSADKSRCLHRIYVSPPIYRWTLLVSDHFLVDLDDTEEIVEYLVDLSKKTTVLQHFGTHRGIGLNHWLLARDGVLIRAFGDLSLETFWNEGEPTSAEPFDFDRLFQGREDADADDLWLPDEDSVMEVAARWSVNPTRLEAISGIAAEGYVCIASPSIDRIWNVSKRRSGMYLRRSAKGLMKALRGLAEL